MIPSSLKVRTHGCPAQSLLALIADKWTAILISQLDGREVRYLQLQREVPGISQKVLTQTLQRLERHGLVRRTEYRVVPPRVEYSLTPLGADLVPLLGGLIRWCEANHPAVEEAKEAFERRSHERDLATVNG